MKTTARVFAGWIAAAMSLSAGIAVAGPFWGTIGVSVGTATVTQVGPSDTRLAGKRQQADDLLRRARQAIEENDLQAAEALISSAEALGVRYELLHFGDTPKKARRDLGRRQKAAAKSPTRPSQLFSHLSLRKKEAPRTDPFAGRLTEPSLLPQSSSAREFGLSNPPRSVTVDASATPLSPFGRRVSAMPPGYDGPGYDAPGYDGPGYDAPGYDGPGYDAPDAGFSMATDMADEDPLLEARRALALGDVQRARKYVQRANEEQASYGPLDDTPDKVGAAIAKYADLKTQPQNTEAFRRAYARMLMEQSEALLRAADYDRAEQLADRASRQRLTYGPFEANPQDLLKRVAAARRQGNPSTSDAAMLTSETQGARTPAPSLAARNKAAGLVRQARAALSAGQFSRGEILARQAEQLGVPDSAFAPNEDRPGLVLLDIRKAQQQNPSGVVQASAELVIPAVGRSSAQPTASIALYDSLNDPTRNIPAAGQQPGPSPVPRELDFSQDSPIPAPARGAPPAPVRGTPPPPAPAGSGTNAESLFQQGETALKAHDKERAYRCFQQAATRMDELDPLTRERLQSYLQLLSAPIRGGPTGGPPRSIVDETAAAQQVLARQVAADVAQQASKARAILPADPKGALALLEETRQKVASSGLEPTARERVLQRVDRHVEETQRFIEQNRPRIELQEKNQQTRDQIERRQRVKLETQEKLALMVDEFNKLMDEGRYEEAEVVAKRAAQLDPENPLIVQLRLQSTLLRRLARNREIRAAAEEGFNGAMLDVDIAGVPFSGPDSMLFPDVKDWRDLTRSRSKFAGDRARERTEADLDIERRLRTKVLLQFKDEPLSGVLDKLSKLTGINIVVDPQGLAEYGVSTDAPVTIELRKEIMLKSALQHILEPLQLGYVIKDEALKITSEQQREGEVYTRVHNVSDLVVPIPNFIAGDMGLASAYHKALGNVGYGGGNSFGGAGTPLAVVASRDGDPNNALINPALLAQVSRPGQSARPGGTPMGFGPGGLSGGSGADFDSIIELITSTIQPDTWDEVGGQGSIREFETNLSLVVSQTQEVHEEIRDLLEQLRRMQDLQVTIEVRFITLNDNFFERIGVDFDFDIDDDIDRPLQVFGRTTGDGDPGAGTEPPRNTLDVDFDRSVTVGMQNPGVFSADLDIPFTQNSFGLAVPQFGGFDAAAGAQLGFAILSDIEAFFFINAAQGDRRSNVLQAPKVTLFNGQQAFVADNSQSPFVISVIPVVGDFAAAQQPVIVVLSEGTMMTVQAVVSNDRRFVRLTVVPFFSKIGKVNTFQFEGTETTTTNTSADSGAFVDPTNKDNDRKDNVTDSNNSTTTSTGTTVQLPTFSFVTVTTTVSVPDGGTVLLGGIKRLSEGRNEFGVPMLNKIPYINRLFKNVGIGRETQSLMMMVTPRIIIQEEEEEKLGIAPPPP